ncbi:hypothetical protein AAF712_012020 [Marasmius tenuissimus]|uniref:Aminotransferase-like plant mobile domain-containing protein n=1 Tax=Marasmius tenuissimus TaxID=585030 RepID=A0ABR2ZII0_9AGAR
MKTTDVHNVVHYNEQSRCFLAKHATEKDRYLVFSSPQNIQSKLPSFIRPHVDVSTINPDSIFSAKQLNWFDPTRPYLPFIPRFDAIMRHHPAFRTLAYQYGRFPIVQVTAGQHRLDPNVAASWDTLERWLRNMATQLHLLGDPPSTLIPKDFQPWPYPSRSGYLTFQSTHPNIQHMAARTRDSFLPLIAHCSLLLFWCHERCQKINDDGVAFEWLTLIKDENKSGEEAQQQHRSWISELLHSFVGDADILRIGTILDGTKTDCPNWLWHLRRVNMPVYIYWGYLDELSGSPLTSPTADYGPWAPRTDEKYVRLYNLAPKNTDIDDLHKTVATNSFTTPHLSPFPSLDPIALQTEIMSIPLFPRSGQLPGECIHAYLQRQKGKHKELSADESLLHRQQRLKREQDYAKKPCPGKRGPRIWYWENADHDFRVRTLMSREEGSHIWARYGFNQKRYDSFQNCWDISSELDDDYDDYDLSDGEADERSNAIPTASLDMESSESCIESSTAVDPLLIQRDSHDTRPNSTNDTQPHSQPCNAIESSETYHAQDNNEVLLLISDAVPSNRTSMRIQQNMGNAAKTVSHTEQRLSQERIDSDTSTDSITKTTTTRYHSPYSSEAMDEDNNTDDEELEWKIMMSLRNPPSFIPNSDNILTVTPQEVVERLILTEEDAEGFEYEFNYSMEDIAKQVYGFTGEPFNVPEHLTTDWNIAQEAFGNGRWMDNEMNASFKEYEPLPFTKNQLRGFLQMIQDNPIPLPWITSPTIPSLDIHQTLSDIHRKDLWYFNVTLRDLNDGLYYHLQWPKTSLSILVHDPVTILRLVRRGKAAAYTDTAAFLFQEGIAFQTLAAGPIPQCDRDEVHTVEETFETKQDFKGPRLGYVYERRKADAHDFSTYRFARNEFLRGQNGRAAGLAGGVIGRIAKEVLNEEDVIHGPEVPRVFSEGKCFFTHEGIGYWDNVLTEEEIDLICGVYYFTTDHTRDYGHEKYLSSHRSWFPRPTSFNASTFNIGFWSKDCEKWYRHRIRMAKTDQADLLSGTRWRGALRFNSHVPRIMKDNQRLARDFVESRL